MENKNKKRILTGLILLLIFINISAIATFSYNKYKRYKHHNKYVAENKNWDNMHHRIKDFVKKELDLNEQQFVTFSQLKDENRVNTEKIFQKIGTLKKMTIVEISSENPDSIKLINLSDSIAEQNKKLQLTMNRHFLAVKAILKPEQKQKFAELLLNMEEHMQWKKNKKHMNRERNCDKRPN